jgi:hypothetical protein
MVSGADTYMWSDGSTLSALEVAPNTDETYTVVGTTINGCSASISVSVQVDQMLTPLFTQVAAICSGDDLSELPTTSLDGIEGTWSPALDNTQTTTYTFTPDAGVCVSPTTMEIVVNTPPVLSISPFNPTICYGTSVTLTASGSDSYFWDIVSIDPDIIVTPTTDAIYTVTGTDANGCSAVQEVSVTVLQPIAPMFTQVEAICSGDS